MRKILLGLAAAAAVATPLAVTTSAQAADPIPVPVPANPLSASALVCNVLPLLPDAPEGVDWSAVTDHRALNGKVGVTATPESGYVFANGATSKAYAAQACLFGQPNVANGVPVYGAYANGVWKLGSKVTLTSGDEFQTHGGTDTSGLVTRYRLVFTPAAGFSLPTTLPDGGFKVGGSAVFHVYEITRAYDDAYFGPVTCTETQVGLGESISCTSIAGTLARPAKESGTVGWNSDFDATRTTGSLTYTVNAAGTGYTGQATYPVA